MKISILLPGGFNPATFKGFILTNSRNISDSQLDDADYNLSKGLEFYNSANYTGALPYLQNAAEAGSGEALNFLGLMYLQGYGVAVNKQVAFNMFSRSAETGYNWGVFNLGYAYYSGNVIKQDYNKAVYWLQKAAQQEIPNALYYLGMMYYEGTGVTKDLLIAKDYFLKAARMNYVPSYAMIAAITDNGWGDREAVSWYKKAAENDSKDTHSPYRLGDIYSGLFFTPSPEDVAEAFKWFKLAAERGHSDAALSVGLCYEDGKGVPKNEQEAIKWFTKAIEYGNISFGAYRLGRMYYYGKGVPQSYAKAFELFTQANKAGNSDAGSFLGDMYAFGQFVEKDDKKAEEEYIKASENYSVIAMYALGNFYYNESLPAKEQESRVIKLYWEAAAVWKYAPARNKLMALAEQGNEEAVQFVNNLKAATRISWPEGVTFSATQNWHIFRGNTSTQLVPSVTTKQGSDLYKVVSEKDSLSNMLVLSFFKRPFIEAGTYSDELEITPEYGAGIKIPVIIESDGKNVVDEGLFYVSELKENSKTEDNKYDGGSYTYSSTISFWIKGIRDGVVLFKVESKLDKKLSLPAGPYIFISGGKLLTATERFRRKTKDRGEFFSHSLDYLNDNRWHLITLCHAGEKWGETGKELYIDGKWVERISERFVTVPVYGEMGSKDYHLKNLRLYTRVLNADEIEQIYLSEAPFMDME